MISNKFFKIKFVKFIIIIFISFNCIAEYLVYERDPDNKTIKIIEDLNVYTEIYNILMRYSWPTNIFYSKDFNKEEKKSLYPVAGAEENYLRKKIQEINPNLDIVFIPTCLYEMIVVNTYVFYFDNNILEVSYNNLLEASILVHQSNLKTEEQKSLAENIKNSLEFLINKFGIKRNFDKNILNKISDANNNIYDILNLFNEINMNESIKNMHYSINNYFINYLKTIIGFLKDLTSEKEQKHIYEIIKNQAFEIANYFLNKDKVATKDYPAKEKTIRQKRVFNKFVSLEYDSYQKQLGLLYRTTKKTEFYIMKKAIKGKKKKELKIILNVVDILESTINLTKYIELKNQKQYTVPEITKDFNEFVNWTIPTRTISYGNSLFAGCFRDIGASVQILMTENDIVYGLVINKYEHINNLKNVKKLLLFNIPNLNTIAGLWAYGDWFHPRTISYVYPKYFQDYYMPAIGSDEPISGLSISKEFRLEDKIGYILRISDPLLMSAKLSEYIGNNAIILKYGSKGFDVELDEINEVIENQKKAAKFLKFMWALEKKSGEKKLIKLKKNLASLNQSLISLNYNLKK